MLGYPLGLQMSSQIRKNDLEAYEPVTDPNGPAMTWVSRRLVMLDLTVDHSVLLKHLAQFVGLQGP